MNMEMFYPPMPKKVPFGRFTFVQPDFNVKFPVFRCCPSHANSSLNSAPQVPPIIQQQQQGPQEPSPSVRTEASYRPMYPSDDYQPPEVIEEMQLNGGNGRHDSLDNFFKDRHGSNGAKNYAAEIQLVHPEIKKLHDSFDHFTGNGHNNENDDVDTMDDFVLEEPANKTSNWEIVEVIQPKAGRTSKEKSAATEIQVIQQPKMEAAPAVDDPEAMDDFVLDDSANKTANWLAFIRRNLVFDVVLKSLANFRKVMDNLRSIYPKGAGIIFCMSKIECEQVADTIGPDAHPFHMDLSNNTRKEIVRRWMNNEVLILCATVAFGKTAIGKRDVRFVIHHTLPQSLQLYEKQCALTGLDERLSHCILLYNFNDHLRIWRLIKEDVPKPSKEVLEMKENALRDVLRYSENIVECRRKLLGAHFGENYSSDRCMMQPAPCTICASYVDGRHPPQLFDFTKEALAVFQSMNGLKNLGVAYIADVFRGQINKKRVKQAVDESNHGRLPLFGLGHGLTSDDCQRLIQMLVIEDYLKLRLVTTKHHTVVGYVELAKLGADFMRKYKQAEGVPQNERIFLHISEAREKRRSSKGTSQLDSAGGGDSSPGTSFLANKRMRY